MIKKDNNLKEMVREQLKNENEEFEEIIEAQIEVENNPHNMLLKSYKFSNIHELIKKARLINGYTQEQFCGLIELNRSTYSRYENGERQIPSEIMDEIFSALNLKMTIETKGVFDEVEDLEE